MRLAYVCTDRDVHVPGPGMAARAVGANLRALERAGHDLAFFGVGEGGVVPGAWRVVRQRAGNGPKELRDHYENTDSAAEGLEVWSLSVNHRLGRTLEEERLRAPLDGVIERLSPWTYAAATFCSQRRVPYILEVTTPPVWQRWRDWDAELESAAQAVHAFTASLARLIVVQSEAMVAAYQTLSNAPVVVLSDLRGGRQGPRPAWARGFTLVTSGPPRPFDDLKTIEIAARLLPDGVFFERLSGSDGLAWADAALVPATLGQPVDLAPYLAAGLPLVVPAGSPAAKLPYGNVRALYSAGDPASLAAAMVAIRDEVRRLPRPRRLSRPAQLAELVTRVLEAG